MDRDQTIEAITAYAEARDWSAVELAQFVGDVTGSQADADRPLANLTPGELELVHEVVTVHAQWEPRRAS